MAKRKGKGHHHTGPIRAHHHGAHGMGGKDPHADPAHHAANSAYGMPHGMSPGASGCCQGGDMDAGGQEESGGEGMDENGEGY